MLFLQEKMKQQICIYFALLLINNLANSAKLPSSIKVCHRGDSNFKQCLKESVGDVLKKLTKPMSSIGLNSLDPFPIKEVLVQPGSKGTVNFEQQYNDIKFQGLSTTNIESADMDFDKNKLTIKGTIPLFDLKGHYKYNGKLLMVELKGNGNCHIQASDLKVTVEISLEEFDKNGKKHYKITDVKSILVPGNIHFNMENLFEGNKQLSDNLNKVLNENWSAVFEDVGDGYQKLFSSIVKSESNNFFNRVPIDEMFPK